MPAWTAMSAKTVGDLIAEADWDAFQGNIEYLLDPNRDQVVYDNSGNYTTTSATYVDVDATNLTLSVTTNGGPLLIYAVLTLGASAAFQAGLQFDVSGVAALTHPILTANIASNGDGWPLMCYYQPAAAGAKTIKLQWKSDGSNTLTLHSSGETVIFGAIEL